MGRAVMPPANGAADPYDPAQAPVAGFGRAMAGLPGWGAEKRCIEKQRYGLGLGFRWTPINTNNQQSTNRRRMCSGRCLGGGAWAGEHVGGDTVPLFRATIQTMKKIYIYNTPQHEPRSKQ